MLKKIIKIAFAHKATFAIVVIFLAVGGVIAYKKTVSTDGETTYVLSPVEKGTMITSVSGSGQISVSNQVDLKAKALATI